MPVANCMGVCRVLAAIICSKALKQMSPTVLVCAVLAAIICSQALRHLSPTVWVCAEYWLQLFVVRH